MRTLALFCGVVAGLFALLAPAGTNVDQLTPFLSRWGGTPDRDTLATIAWYAPTVTAIIAGMLAVVLPAAGGVLMLLAAGAWLAIALSGQQFFTIHLWGPAGVALVGALLSLLIAEFSARRRRDEPEEPRPVRRRPQRDPEADEREAAFSMDPRLVTREEAPPRPAREIPLTLEDVAPPEPRSEPVRRRSESIWPDETNRESNRKSIFERIDVADLPRRSLIAERETADSRRNRRQDAEPAEDQPRRWVPWLVAGNVAVVLVLAVIIGNVMLNPQRPAGGTAAATAVAEPAPANVTVPQAGAAQVADAEPERLIPNLWPSLADPSAPPADVTAVGTAAAGPVPAAATANVGGAVGGGLYTDPHAYCAAVVNVDYVDARYSGPRFTPDIAEALRVPLESAPDRVSWRCVNGVVWACASFDWPVCAATPTANEMLEYCRRNPTIPRLLAPNGTWACVSGRPSLPEGASWPVDQRGFFPNAWIPVVAPVRPVPQSG